MVISLIEILIVQQNADCIAVSFLGDARCSEMLLIISYALPCAAVHSCICGYSFGLQNAKLPAVTQLIEQGFRIFFVLLAVVLLRNGGRTPTIHLAAAGIVAGELAAALSSGRILAGQRLSSPTRIRTVLKNTRELIGLSLLSLQTAQQSPCSRV